MLIFSHFVFSSFFMYSFVSISIFVIFLIISSWKLVMRLCTIMDLFGNVGGVYGLLISLWSFFVGIISSQILLSSVFRRLYYTNKFNKKRIFIKFADRSTKISNLPIEESKSENLRSRFMSMLSKKRRVKVSIWHWCPAKRYKP